MFPHVCIRGKLRRLISTNRHTVKCEVTPYFMETMKIVKKLRQIASNLPKSFIAMFLLYGINTTQFYING